MALVQKCLNWYPAIKDLLSFLSEILPEEGWVCTEPELEVFRKLGFARSCPTTLYPLRLTALARSCLPLRARSRVDGTCCGGKSPAAINSCKAVTKCKSLADIRPVVVTPCCCLLGFAALVFLLRNGCISRDFSLLLEVEHIVITGGKNGHETEEEEETQLSTTLQ